MSNVTRLPHKLMPWEKDCIHDILDICKAEGIPLRFGMPYFQILRLLYRPTRLH